MSLSRKIMVGVPVVGAALAAGCADAPQARPGPTLAEQRRNMLGVEGLDAQREGVGRIASYVEAQATSGSLEEAAQSYHNLRQLADAETAANTSTSTAAVQTATFNAAGRALSSRFTADLATLTSTSTTAALDSAVLVAAEVINQQARGSVIQVDQASVAGVTTYTITDRTREAGQNMLQVSRNSVSNVTTSTGWGTYNNTGVDALAVRETALYNEIRFRHQRPTGNVRVEYTERTDDELVRAYLNTAAGRNVEVRVGMIFDNPARVSESNPRGSDSAGLKAATEEDSNQPSGSLSRNPRFNLREAYGADLLTAQEVIDLVAEARPDFYYLGTGQAGRADEWLVGRNTPIRQESLNALMSQGLVSGSDGRLIRSPTQMSADLNDRVLG